MQERKDPWSVDAWMTPNPHTISPDTSVRHAFIRMRSEGYLFRDRKFGAVPVIDRNRAPIGILTTHDLLGAFASAMEESGSRLRGS